MKHYQFQELVSLFIDRELDAGREQELFGHLSDCEECRTFLKASMMLQNDILSTKLKEIKSHGRTPVGFAFDRGPVQRMNQRPTVESPVSTLVLLLMILMAVGILFSANIEDRTPPRLSDGIGLQAR